MLRLVAPGARGAPEGVRLVAGEPPLVVGRSGVPIDGLLNLVGARRCSRRHGAFAVDLRGAVRYVDLGSRSGTLLLPARGTPQVVTRGRPVTLWPGDAVALGARAEVSPDEARRTLYVISVESWAAPPVEDDCDTTEGVPDAAACAVCQEPLQSARVLACGHAFCDDCISRWLREHETCPTCRATCDDDGAACPQLDDAVLALVGALGGAAARGALARHAEDRRRLLGAGSSVPPPPPLGGIKRERDE